MLKAGLRKKYVTEKLSIPKQNIKRWEKIGAKRIPGGGRKVLDPQMEDQVFSWMQT